MEVLDTRIARKEARVCILVQPEDVLRGIIAE
jgi:hypothetical protein